MQPQAHLTDRSFPRHALSINPNPNSSATPPPPSTVHSARRVLQDRGTVSAPTSPLGRGAGLWDSPAPQSAGGLFETLARPFPSPFCDPLSSFSTHTYPSSLFSPSHDNITHSHSHSRSHPHGTSPRGNTVSTTTSRAHIHSHSHSHPGEGGRITSPHVSLPFPDLPSAATDFPGLSLPFYSRSEEDPGAERGTYGISTVGVSTTTNTNAIAKSITNGQAPNLDPHHNHKEDDHPAQTQTQHHPASSTLHTPAQFLGDVGIEIERGRGPNSGIPSASRSGSAPNSADSRLGQHPLDVDDGRLGKKQKRAQVRVACTHCQKACKKCSNTRPCERCVKYGLPDCVDSTRKPRKTGVKRGPYKRRSSKFGEINSLNPLQPPATAHAHAHPHSHPHSQSHSQSQSRLAPLPRTPWFGATQPSYPAHPTHPTHPAHPGQSHLAAVSLPIHPQSATVQASFARGSLDPRQIPGQVQGRGQGQVQVQGQGQGQKYQHQPPWQQTSGAQGLAHGDPVPPPRSRAVYPLHRPVSAGFGIRDADAAAAASGAGTGGTGGPGGGIGNPPNSDGATLSPHLLLPGLGQNQVQPGSQTHTPAQTHAQNLRRPSLPHGTLPSLPSDAGLHSALAAALAGPRWVNGQRVSAEYPATDQSLGLSTNTNTYPANPFHAGVGGSAATTNPGIDGPGALGAVGGDDSPGVLLPETPKVPFPISLRGGGDPFSRAVSPIRSNGHMTALLDQNHNQADGRTMFVDALLRSLGRDTDAPGSASGLGGAEAPAPMESRSGMSGMRGLTGVTEVTGGTPAPNSPATAGGLWHSHGHTPGLGFDLGLGSELSRDEFDIDTDTHPARLGTWSDHFTHFGPVFSEPSSPTQPSSVIGGLPFPRSASAGPPPSSAPPMTSHFPFDAVTRTPTPGSNDAYPRRAVPHAWSALTNPSGQQSGQGQGQGHARGPAQSQAGRTASSVAGSVAGSHFLPHSPALIALKKIRKPSLRTLISPLSSVTNSRAPSPIQEEQSPTLWNGPMQLDDVDELDGMGVGVGVGLDLDLDLGMGSKMGSGMGSGMGGASGAAAWGLASASGASGASGSGSGSGSMSVRQSQGQGHEQLHNQETSGRYGSAQGQGRNDGEAPEGELGKEDADALGLMGLEGFFGA